MKNIALGAAFMIALVAGVGSICAAIGYAVAQYSDTWPYRPFAGDNIYERICDYAGSGFMIVATIGMCGIILVCLYGMGAMMSGKR